MTLGYEPKMGTLVLSRGQDFWYTSFLKNGYYPPNTEARIEITDAAGGLLLTITGDVQVNRIVFNASDEDVDGIPAGSNFEMLLDYESGDSFKPEFGTVVRKEAQFPLVDPTILNPIQVTYNSNWDTGQVGPKWKSVGQYPIQVNSNVLIGERKTMGPAQAGLTSSAVRWLWPMNGDSLTIVIRVANRGEGKFNVVFCADQLFENYIGVQFDTSLASDKIWPLVSDGSPREWTTPFADGESDYVYVPGRVSNGDTYTIKYNHTTFKTAVYQNTSLEPLITYTHDEGAVLHGVPYRYVGFSWQTAIFTTGAEPTDFEARDGV